MVRGKQFRRYSFPFSSIYIICEKAKTYFRSLELSYYRTLVL
nr:MAG TPA: hypothetical protein [Caudoviricetes sp.]